MSQSRDLIVAEERLVAALRAVRSAKRECHGGAYRGWVRFARLMAEQAINRLEQEQTR